MNPNDPRWKTRSASTHVGYHTVGGEAEAHPALDAADKAVQGIAKALGSEWRVKESGFYTEKSTLGYVGEVWSKDTSSFKIRVEVNEKGVVDIDPYANLNATGVQWNMAHSVFNKLDVKGDTNKVVAVLRNAPQVAVEALEAATRSKAAMDAMESVLLDVLAKATAISRPKLEKNHWALEFNKIYPSNSYERDGKPRLSGSISVTDIFPAGDSKEATKCRKIFSDVAKAVSKDDVLMTLPSRVGWSANNLQIPFEIGYTK